MFRERLQQICSQTDFLQATISYASRQLRLILILSQGHRPELLHLISYVEIHLTLLLLRLMLTY